MMKVTLLVLVAVASGVRLFPTSKKMNPDPEDWNSWASEKEECTGAGVDYIDHLGGEGGVCVCNALMYKEKEGDSYQCKFAKKPNGDTIAGGSKPACLDNNNFKYNANKFDKNNGYQKCTRCGDNQVYNPLSNDCEQCDEGFKKGTLAGGQSYMCVPSREKCGNDGYVDMAGGDSNAPGFGECVPCGDNEVLTSPTLNEDGVRDTHGSCEECAEKTQKTFNKMQDSFECRTKCARGMKRYSLGGGEYECRPEFTSGSSTDLDQDNLNTRAAWTDCGGLGASNTLEMKKAQMKMLGASDDEIQKFVRNAAQNCGTDATKIGSDGYAPVWKNFPDDPKIVQKASQAEGRAGAWTGLDSSGATLTAGL